MVRENENSPSGPGVDANKNVELEKTLKEENLWTGDTIDPQKQSNVAPIDIRSDVGKPDKRG